MNPVYSLQNHLCGGRRFASFAGKMNLRGCLLRRFAGLLATLLLGAVGTFAQSSTNLISTNVVNDGTTTANLARIINANGTAGADLTLAVDPNFGNALLAQQSPDLSDFPISAAWYPTGLQLLGTNYTVLADVLPADTSGQNRIGVMGWLDPVAGQGIAFRTIPSSFAGVLEVIAIDFNAASGDTNESTTSLFNLDGSPAFASLGSTWSDLAGYDPTSFATLSLTFALPTGADRAVLANVTTHLTAQAFQSSAGTTNLTQIGETIELLTSLPTPATNANAFGYYASWGTVFVPGDVIGDVRNLTIIGDLVLPNQPPQIALTAPADKATFTAPANVTLTASASDPDGTVARVDFYVGANLIGTATNAPFTVTAANLAAGSYMLTARATDNLGATTLSAPVSITVSTVSGPITLTSPKLLSAGTNSTSFQFTINGTAGATVIVETSGDLSAWTPVGTNVLAGPTNVVSFPTTAGKKLAAFRARSSGTNAPTFQITSLALMPDPTNFRQFQFTVSGLNGLHFEIDGSTDLVKWTSLTNGVGQGAVQQFTFDRLTTPPYDFFRLLVWP